SDPHGGGEHGARVHAGRGQHGGLDEDDVGEGDERGRAADDLRAHVGPARTELEEPVEAHPAGRRTTAPSGDTRIGTPSALLSAPSSRRWSTRAATCWRANAARPAAAS